MKYKKIIEMILVMSLITSGFVINKSVFASNEVTVNVSSTSGNVGDEVTVSVSLANAPASGITSASFVLEYDQSKLDFVKLAGGEILFDKDKDISAEVIDINAIYDSTYISSHPNIQRGLKILYNDFDQTGDSYIKRNGVLCDLTFKIRSEFSSGEIILRPNTEDSSGTASTSSAPFYTNYTEDIQAVYNSGKIKVPREAGTPTPTSTPSATQTPGSAAASATPAPASNTPISSSANQTTGSEKTNMVQDKKPKLTLEMMLGEPDVTINDKKQLLNANNSKVVPAFGENGAIMPANEISKIIGYVCEWNATEKKIKISSKSRVTEMWIGKKKIVVNGKTKPVSEYPELIDNKPYLPLCMASIAFECIVEWDKQNDQLVIKKY
ncbi:MAG: cohesin domain-containing protein [Bacillota bacterium]|nr:cohesin domain-containing protein [Bacillota bacterium]